MTDSPFSQQHSMIGGDDDRITYFGITDSRGKRTQFGIKKEDRSRHTYVIGKTGMGKSTLLENMVVQDIQNGEGVCFIDPHGSTAEKLLDYIPEHRIKDVLYFAPFDMQYPISFNVLENVDADKRHLVVAGLMSTFEKIWVDAWSARMAYILQNTIGALLEFPGATLLGVNRMYIDKEYRKNVVAKITDSSVRSFWVDEYTKYTDRYAQEATPAIQNKIGQFAANALVRNVIGQSESSFNIRELMDSRKIFIVNLSKGRVGEGNANLLGSMLITKIYLAAMSRADSSAGTMRGLPPFFLYVDEFQNFANKSFADILSEARKYKLALTVAHQYIEQMEEEVRAAVFGNVGTMLAFRVGAYDAEVLEKEFAPVFSADDLVNLGSRQIYLKLMIDGVSSQPFSASTMPPIEEPSVSYHDRAIAYSRAQYSRPRDEVEKNISEWVDMKYADPEAPAKEAARQERRAARAADGTPQSQPFRSAPRQGTRPVHQGEGAYRTAQRPRQFSRDTERPRDQVRTYVASDEHEPVREGVRNVPTRTGPRTRAVARPRPLAPEQKQASMADLRSVLSRMSPAQESTSDNTPQQPISSAPASLNTERSQTSVTPERKEQRDDGKGVTDEGKQQLRDLLTSLNQTPDAPNKKVEQVPPKTNVRPQPSVPQSVQSGHGGPTPKPSTPQQHTEPLRPVEISPEELKTMLHVDKPDSS